MSYPKLIFGTTCALLLAGATACTMHNPARVLAPESYGLTCPTALICIDDETALPQAQRLTDDAISFVETRLWAFEKPPRLLFCTTTTCFAQFGNPAIAGQNIGTYGAVINVTGWKDHIVRHELIHHLQNERFGVARASIFLPDWYIEGMAYALSEDPRDPLPRADIEAYRAQFEAWVADGNDWLQPPRR